LKKQLSFHSSFIVPHSYLLLIVSLLYIRAGAENRARTPWPRLFINKRRTRKAPFGAFDIQDQSDFVFPQKSLDTPAFQSAV
jgi:hypothetical protein